MHVPLALARVWVPRLIRRRKLEELFGVTAAAFGCQTPPLRGLPLSECLERYTVFTREKAEESIRLGTEAEVKVRLFRGAAEIGTRLRSDFRIRAMADVMQTAQIVYKILGIEFHGGTDGGIRVSRCAFSVVYSGAVCRVISSLDEGLFAGLCPGAELHFTQRMTEGAACCTAHLLTKEIPNEKGDRCR